MSMDSNRRAADNVANFAAIAVRIFPDAARRRNAFSVGGKVWIDCSIR